jgi:5-enolpyruvylshikimate-3-phosphate synthase
MRDATLRDRVNHLLTASERSEVPPFMVMDVMSAAARIEAAGGRVIHMEVGQPAAGPPASALAAARAALGGRLEVSGAAELRVKESDRITALVSGFRAMGVAADERPDGFVIDGSKRPTGGTADAASDHRLVMAFTLVALGSTGPSTVTDAGAVAVSYPAFADDLRRLTE